MARGLTDEQVEIELKKVRATPEYKLGIKERGLKNKRRQLLYRDKWLQKRGAELMAMGITVENIKDVMFPEIEEGENE